MAELANQVDIVGRVGLAVTGDMQSLAAISSCDLVGAVRNYALGASHAMRAAKPFAKVHKEVAVAIRTTSGSARIIAKCRIVWCVWRVNIKGSCRDIFQVNRLATTGCIWRVEN